MDPVKEEAPHLEVKIADLGNACWVVSGSGFTAFKNKDAVNWEVVVAQLVEH